MSEWISKEAVLRICEEVREDSGDIRTIISKCNRLPIKCGGEWISVKERLPESDNLVLVSADGKPIENVTLVGAYELAVYDPEEKEWILEMWPEWGDVKVTHWMPLPEPPKEG